MVTPYEIGTTLPCPTAASDVVAAPSGQLDAPPSNRASNTCNTPWFEAYSLHIDSLEVSFPGVLSAPVSAHLRGLKEKAQSKSASERAEAQIVLGGECFQVRDKGAGRFPFIVDNEKFFIKLSSLEATSLPLASCQVRSRYLAQVGAVVAVAGLKALLEGFGEVHGEAVVSRADLAVDFSTDIAIEQWPMECWVTKLGQRHAYADGQLFTGWSIGSKTSFQFGLYNKTHEIETQSHKTYLYDVWKEKGWFMPDVVWRAEARFRRSLLAQLGISSLPALEARLGSLWSYATQDLVRLTVPTEGDRTRSRWPLHPLWECLVSVDWGVPPVLLKRQYKGLGAPSDEMIARQVIASLTSLMARDAISDPDEAFVGLKGLALQNLSARELATGESREEYLETKAKEKARRWHTGLNVAAGLPTSTPRSPESLSYLDVTGRR